MTLYILGNKFHLDENVIFSDWPKKSIFRIGLEPSIPLQRVAGLDPQRKLIYNSDI